MSGEGKIIVVDFFPPTWDQQNVDDQKKSRWTGLYVMFASRAVSFFSQTVSEKTKHATWPFFWAALNKMKMQILKKNHDWKREYVCRGKGLWEKRWPSLSFKDFPENRETDMRRSISFGSGSAPNGSQHHFRMCSSEPFFLLLLPHAQPLFRKKEEEENDAAKEARENWGTTATIQHSRTSLAYSWVMAIKSGQ